MEEKEVILVLMVIYKYESPEWWEYVEILFVGCENWLSWWIDIKNIKKTLPKF